MNLFLNKLEVFENFVEIFTHNKNYNKDKDKVFYQNGIREQPVILYYEKFEVPNEICIEITKERHTDYLIALEDLNNYIFENIYDYDYEIYYLKFGNIYNWTFFTDFIEPSLLAEQGAGLIIKGKYPYPIGYIYTTDCNDIYIDILYKTYDEYMIDYLKWQEKPIENNLSEIIDLYKNDLDCEKLKNIDFICNSMPTFTEYILIKKDILNIEISFE